ncbi:MAG: hypothetical protein NTY22_04855 [Proteobacteria bacterium]|nr:hypothetical protein [Pseudomonadota bacterium]
MKKILFITLATLVFVSCSGRSGRDGGTTTNPPIVPSSCSDSNATLVNGTCECNTGYADDQGTCVQIQLATPTLRATGTVSGCFVIAFNDVQDLSSNKIASGKIYFIYKNMTVNTSKASTGGGGAIDANMCNKTYTDPVSCGVGNIYPPAVTPIGAGTYCIKAISCADGYKDSAIFIKQQTITSGSGGGTAIDCTANNTSTD